MVDLVVVWPFNALVVTLAPVVVVVATLERVTHKSRLIPGAVKTHFCEADTEDILECV